MAIDKIIEKIEKGDSSTISRRSFLVSFGSLVALLMLGTVIKNEKSNSSTNVPGAHFGTGSYGGQKQ